MTQVLVKGYLKQNQETMNIKENGVLENDVVTFYRKKEQTKYHFNFKTSILTRENDQMKMTLCFNEKANSEIVIKELNQKLILPIEIKFIQKEETLFLANYAIEEENFIFKLEIEKKGI